jgi:AcrR family transcriptional regulator
MGARSRPALRRPASARERIDHAAYQLFSRHSIRTVGVDTVAARAGVAKMTLYKHYPSKDALALAFLRRREELWTRAWLQQEVERRARTPRAAAVGHMETLREFLGELAKLAGVRDPDEFARQWLMLMMGCILAAYAGDLRAAKPGKKVAAALLAQEERGHEA